MNTDQRDYLYGSHIPALIDALSVTTGPVVEIGSGFYSTPFLHWWCWSTKRPLTTYEQDPAFYQWAKQFANDYHTVVHVANYDDMDLSPKWSVALVDNPVERRRKEMVRLRHAQYVVLHDSNRKFAQQPRRIRGYRYRKVYAHPEASTTVFSNVNAPRNLGIQSLVGNPSGPLQIVTDREMQDTQPGQSRRYTICRAVREVYVALTDPVLKRKLRYACSLAEAVCNKVDRHDPGWLRRFYPRRNAFERIMGDSHA